MNMTTTFALAAVVLLGGSGLVAWKTFNANVWHQPAPAMASFHDLTAETLEGDAYAFSDLKGKRVMIVNTASRCGYTPQYGPLEELHDKYKDQGLVILGFPCNQFGMQEPGSSSDIREFCTRNYGVSFQMMSKVDVKGQPASCLRMVDAKPQRRRRPQGALELPQVPHQRARRTGGRPWQRRRSPRRGNRGLCRRQVSPCPFLNPIKKGALRRLFSFAWATSERHSSQYVP